MLFTHRSNTGSPTETPARHSLCMLHTAHRWTVLAQAGLVDDSKLARLSSVAVGAVHVRLILGVVGQPCHCCSGDTAVIVAVSGNDPSLPEGMSAALSRHGPGIALVTAGADHLAGAILASEAGTIPIERSGIDDGAAVVVHYADAFHFLRRNPDLTTVAVLRLGPTSMLPCDWERDDTPAGPVSVVAGWRQPVSVAGGDL